MRRTTPLRPVDPAAANVRRAKLVGLCGCLVLVLCVFWLGVRHPNSGSSLWRWGRSRLGRKPTLDVLAPAVRSEIFSFEKNVQLVHAVQPTVKIVENFLSPEECKHIIELAEPLFKRSQVAAGKDGSSKQDKVRTSSGCWLDRNDADPVIVKLTHRIERFSGVPRSHGEALQVLRYYVGQEYRPHPDYFDPKIYGQAFGLKDKGQRVATSITYLNTVPGGGGTKFPKVNVTVDAVQGRGMVFRNVDKEGRIDPFSFHAGLPVEQGTKYVIVQWLRENEF